MMATKIISITAEPPERYRVTMEIPVKRWLVRTGHHIETLTRTAYLSGPEWQSYSWLDTCEYVGCAINRLLRYMARHELEELTP